MFRAERIDERHRIDRFRCGNDALDGWLHRSALNADRRGNARTYLWLDDQDEVAAYYALCPWSVRREDGPPAVTRGGQDVIPAILLARLALREDLHGHEQRYGSALLGDAVRAALEGVAAVGGNVIVVDAIDGQAKAYYEHFGFRPAPNDPMRLYIKASTAAKAWV